MKDRRHCQDYTDVADNITEKKHKTISSDIAIFLMGLAATAILYVLILAVVMR